MFFDYRFDSLTQLSEKFLDLLSSKNLDDPFVKNWIIVQNKEMQQWVTLQEAKNNSISANNEFIFPSEFLWKLYRLNRPELPKYLPSDRIPLQWTIFEALNEDHVLLGKIVRENSTDQKLLLQLSKTISDVFDLYQVYRPELLIKWEHGLLVYNTKHEKWQAELWRNLSTKWKSEKDIITRVDAFNDLCSWLKNDSFPYKKVPDNIWIVSLPQFSKPFSETISLLSQHKQIHNFGYSFGRSDNNKDALLFKDKLLKSHYDNVEVLSTSLITSKADFKENVFELAKNNTSKLEAVQLAIIDKKVKNYSDSDGSIKIHSCHNKKREAEILKDVLLNALNEDPKLNPEDCLILVPRLEDYQITLTEVFSETINEPKLPIGRGFFDVSSISKNTLLELLNVLNSDFKVNAVLELLENPVIASKWYFDESDIKALRNWAIELRLHRGFDGTIFSWASALDKLFLGYVMEPDKFKVYEDKAVYSRFISKESAELIAKTSSFINLLKIESLNLKSALTIENWIEKIIHLAEVFLQRKFDQEFGIQTLVNDLQELKKKLHPFNSKEGISFELFLTWFKENFSTSDFSGSGFGHGITINEFVPNRNIPYKFVAILGLSENVFPVSNTRPEFDLIHKFPEKGDRIEQHEQRYLFFDMINAAQEILHISYLGENSQSKISNSPSVFVQELLEICTRNNIILEIERHRLHGFEKEYFNINSKRLLSYSVRRKNIAENILELHKRDQEFFGSELVLENKENPLSVSVNDLISFFSHPLRFFCRNKLNINNFEDTQEPEDRELFTVESLNKYSLKEFLTESFFEDLDESKILDVSRASGLLPEGFAGQLDFDSNMKLIKKLKTVKQNFDLTSKKVVEVEIDLEPYILDGTVDNVLDDTRLDIRLGKLKGKNLLRLWINHLVLNFNSKFKSQLFYFDSNDELDHLTLIPDIIDPKIGLSLLLDFYSKANAEPSSYIFPPETSFAFAESLYKNDSVDQAKKAALKKWNTWSGFSEKDDYYNSLIFESEDFITTSDFQNSSKEIWFPILKVIEEAK
jgi:exodeoxyribonuclease V gamma subunit